MIFYEFYLKLTLHDSLENSFPVHLEWLKFQKSYWGFHPQMYLTMPFFSKIGPVVPKWMKIAILKKIFNKRNQTKQSLWG